MAADAEQGAPGPERDPTTSAAVLAALAQLPGIGPVRLLALHRAGAPAAVWDTVCAGRADRLAALDGRMGSQPPVLARTWAEAAAGVDPAAVLAAHEAAGCRVVALGTPQYPAALVDDPLPPAVLFVQGHPQLLELPSVAVVGTRNATRAGRDFAFDLGAGLAAAGVAVVSGLALGIDGAAHRGVLSAVDAADPALGRAPGLPIGVVAAGLDIAYPRRHADLHDAVRSCGVLVSEVALGGRPEAWRFPARNRIIAALARAVVVVESRGSGGSMITAGAALDRGVPVLAVPGDVRSPVAAGTNDLIADGAHPARDLDDVLVAIGRGGGVRRPAAA
ncbi:MAG: dprA, partial [Acidimicrobiales bacterium]|nr:dprA [Acidimicrobiales bacterium]